MRFRTLQGLHPIIRTHEIRSTHHSSLDDLSHAAQHLFQRSSRSPSPAGLLTRIGLTATIYRSGISASPVEWTGVRKYVAHGSTVQRIAARLGWFPAARYTNLRDIRAVHFRGVGFLDIHWKKYDFARHLRATQEAQPLITVARDIESIWETEAILREAEALAKYSSHVVLVPKDLKLATKLDSLLPREYLLGFSVPTRYGGTRISPSRFRRPVHLLGGRPDVQRELAMQMPVVSLDCNRFTLDAAFGDFFDGETFRPHPRGGYERCLRDSITNIDSLWRSYQRTLRAN
jgi:hypothetical protein